MPDDTEYVLNYINELRRDYGLGMPLNRIPVGYASHCFHCPIARALEPAKVIVEPNSIYFHDLDEQIEPPFRITSFIRDVDRGEYPDLIVKPVTE